VIDSNGDRAWTQPVFRDEDVRKVDALTSGAPIRIIGTVQIRMRSGCATPTAQASVELGDQGSWHRFAHPEQAQTDKINWSVTELLG